MSALRSADPGAVVTEVFGQGSLHFWHGLVYPEPYSVAQEGEDMSRQGVSVKEAAVALGVSQKTIRRRIRTGILPAEKVPRPGGFEYRVDIDQAIASSGQPAPQVISPTVQGLLAVLRDKDGEIRQLQNERAQLMAQLGRLQERTETLQKLLEAPKGVPWWGRLLRRG